MRARLLFAAECLATFLMGTWLVVLIAQDPGPPAATSCANCSVQFTARMNPPLFTLTRDPRFYLKDTEILRWDEKELTLTITRSMPRAALVCIRDVCKLAEEWVPSR